MLSLVLLLGLKGFEHGCDVAPVFLPLRSSILFFILGRKKSRVPFFIARESLFLRRSYLTEASFHPTSFLAEAAFHRASVFAEAVLSVL